MDSTDTPAGEVLERHVYCIECGYDLFGLDRPGRCPECGTDIELSLRSDLLEFANPDWLSKLVQGTTVILWTAIVANAVSFLIPLVGARIPFAFSLSWIVTISSAGLWAWAVYRLTTPEPRTGIIEPRWSWRRILRASALLRFMLVLLRLLPYELAPQSVRMSLWIRGYALHLLLPFALCAYALAFSPRLGHRALARPTAIVQWGLLILGVAGFALNIITAYSPASGPIGSSPVTGLQIALFARLGLGVVFGVFGLILLNRYRRILRDARREARAWATDPKVNAPKTP